MDTNEIEPFDNVAVHTLEVGDQIIVEGEHFIIHSITETDDIDEFIVKGENLDDPTNDEISLFADDIYPLWSI